MEGSELLERAKRETVATEITFYGRDDDVRKPRECELTHGESIVEWSEILRERVLVHRHDDNEIDGRGRLNVDRTENVPNMRRIEAAPEDGDAD
jgi:hypothetical protein